MHWLRPLSSLALTLLLTMSLCKQWGNNPPLLFLLNPFSGIWQNTDKKPVDQTLIFSNLLGPVEVVYDKYKIPHIFASTESDAYFTQGYVTARDRLWQMEIQSRVAEGTLSQIFGAKTIESDRFFLRAGVFDAAQANYDRIRTNPVSNQAVEAYTAGVNLYIDSLAFKDYPVEYKIFNVKPRKWKPEYASNILKLMDFTLSARSQDVKLSRVLAKLGRPVVDDLFPILPFNLHPIFPPETKWPKYSSPKSEKLIPDIISLEDLPLYEQPDENNGSNNWAISGTKTKNAQPILANDTHLSYRLPNLFYEMQITISTNPVYGVAIPGLPSIVLGFNKQVAWGVTNANTDVMDWYKIILRDDGREYQINNEWKKTAIKEYKIFVRGQKTLFEKVITTDFGPIVYDLKEKPLKPDFGSGLALKWGTHYPGNEIASFLNINKSKNFYDFRNSLESFNSPAQNFIFADNAGHIGLISRGLIPKRKINQGRFVILGNKSANNWQDFYSIGENPQVLDPAQGYIGSANQPPVDENFPFYFGSEYAQSYRAARIDDLLKIPHKKHDYVSMLRMQNDEHSSLAEELVPHLLHNLITSDLDENQKIILKLISNWRFQYTGKSVAPIIFEDWISAIENKIWKSRFGNENNFSWPSISTTSNLLKNNPSSFWFDDPETKTKETAKNVVTDSYKFAVNKNLKLYGENIKSWRWGYIRKTEFAHISKIPAFSRSLEGVGGSRYSLFANRGDHGPVFRMVVSLEKRPRAWILIPGGPSGNPLSKHYDNWLQLWQRGLTKEVNFWQTLNEAKTKTETLKFEK